MINRNARGSLRSLVKSAGSKYRRSQHSRTSDLRLRLDSPRPTRRSYYKSEFLFIRTKGSIIQSNSRNL